VESFRAAVDPEFKVVVYTDGLGLLGCLNLFVIILEGCCGLITTY